MEFIKLREDHLEQVLKWRTNENVTKYMYTDVQYDMESQIKWFEKVSLSTTEKYWIISIKETPVGVISLNEIDYANGRTSWGYYIGDDRYQMYGGIIPPYLYNYVFYEMNLNKITAEVMEGNDNIMKIHKLHGYRDIGVFKKHVYKHDKYNDVFIMELHKDQWDLSTNKFKKYVGRFENI